MHAAAQFLFDHLELRRSHAVSTSLPFDLEFARASFGAGERETQEVEGLRFAEPTPLTAFRRKASELERYSLLGPDFHRLDRTSLRLAHLFDHLVGATQERKRKSDSKGLGYAEVE